MDDTQEPESPPVGEAAWEYVLVIREALTLFAGLDLTQLGDDDVRDLLVAVEENTRMQPAICGRPLVRQVADRGMDTTVGCRSVVSYLQQLLRIRPAEATARIREVDWFQPRTTVTTSPWPGVAVVALTSTSSGCSAPSTTTSSKNPTQTPLKVNGIGGGR